MSGPNICGWQAYPTIVATGVPSAVSKPITSTEWSTGPSQFRPVNKAPFLSAGLLLILISDIPFPYETLQSTIELTASSMALDIFSGNES